MELKQHHFIREMQGKEQKMYDHWYLRKILAHNTYLLGIELANRVGTLFREEERFIFIYMLFK